MIEVTSLSKAYGDLTAVANLSFRVGAGEVLGLVGPNGAGKTTTLRCVCGILPPSAGSVRIGGHDLKAEPVAAKRELAFMPDEPNLFPYLTVADHLALTARLWQVDGAKEKGRVLLDELELAGKENAIPSELSRGMRQKLVVACGLLHDPKALIFDEPLTGIDPGGIRRMKQTIVRRAREGAAVVVSSHLLHLVEEICDRVLILSRGALVLLGTLDEIQAQAGAGGSTLEEIFLRVTEGQGSGPAAAQ
ncbi:MAG: ABC transporter ATP-binding protein [Deltaproteobacteria bacterium]|nr:ABC transporter ATP-binding protein [Deltaproteobacteria bacterium]